MIKNNSLSDRLNSYKQRADSNNTSPDVISNVMTSLYIIFLTVTRVFVFGFSAKIIWNTSWKFWEVICVGIAITSIINYITDIFKSKL
jgi:hypothetical protein